MYTTLHFHLKSVKATLLHYYIMSVCHSELIQGLVAFSRLAAVTWVVFSG